MKTALDMPPEMLDQHERSFVGKIREFGWFDTQVAGESGKPGFSYSTGFWASLRKPEWILFGLRPEIAHDVLWNVFRDMRSGWEPAPGRRTDAVFANAPAHVFRVDRSHYAEHLGWSRWFYGGDDFPCLQIVWADRAGVFPWESGFDQAFSGSQSDLAERGWQAALAH